jgi:hypothetical protein
MPQVSDAEHLSIINCIRSAFLDRKSLEVSTGNVKQKYKLLTSRVADVYLFHVLTTRPDTYPREQSINISSTDWEHREGTHLSASISILGCQHFDVLSQNDVLIKRKERDNGMPFVGRISQSKLSEILTFIKKYNQMITPKTNLEARNTLQDMFEKRTVNDIKAKLGI